jgi:hypothetical protein
MKHDVPENFEFGKPFLMSAESYPTQETPQLVLDSEFIGCDKHRISNHGTIVELE